MTNTNQSIFAIESAAPSPKGFGTGFVVAREGRASWVVTCSHVVEQTGGVEMTRIAGLPVSSDADGGPQGVDLQVLRVDGLTDAAPLDLGTIARGVACRIPGFRREAGRLLYRELHGTLTNESGIVGEKGLRIKAWEVEIAEGNGFQPGYSGAPVLDSESGRVLGVVSLSQQSGRMGICIAIENLEQIWPGVPSSQAASIAGPGERRTALRITLDSWEDRLARSPKRLDELMEGNPLTPRDEPLHTLVQAISATLEADLAVEIYSHRRGVSQPLKSADDFLIILLAEIAMKSAGPLKWLIKETIQELRKDRAKPETVIYRVWSYICRTFCSHQSPLHSPEVLSRIVSAAIELAAGRNYDTLYRFFSFLYGRLEGDSTSIRRVAQLLEKYDKKLGNNASPDFLERLKLLIGTGIVTATHGVDDIPPFRPDLVTIPAGQLCDYQFEAMVDPLRNIDYSQIRGVRTREQRALHPYVFRVVSEDERTLFNLLSSEVQAIVRLCNQFEGAEDLVWDVPTLCEWLSLAGCEGQPYPWGTEPPTPAHANLFYGGPNRLRPVGTHPLGNSIHGTHDCCGNVHEIIRIGNAQEAEFPSGYRLAGSCYLTSSQLGSCHIVRPFRTRREDNRHNVGLRLVRFDKGALAQRETALSRFLASDHPAAVSSRRS